MSHLPLPCHGEKGCVLSKAQLFRMETIEAYASRRAWVARTEEVAQTEYLLRDRYSAAGIRARKDGDSRPWEVRA
jgi:hypothetical protein